MGYMDQRDARRDARLERSRARYAKLANEVALSFNGKQINHTKENPTWDIPFDDGEGVAVRISLNQIWRDYHPGQYNMRVRSWVFENKDRWSYKALIKNPLDMQWWSSRYYKNIKGAMQKNIEKAISRKNLNEFIESNSSAVLEDDIKKAKAKFTGFVGREMTLDDMICALESMELNTSPEDDKMPELRYISSTLQEAKQTETKLKENRCEK